MFDIFNLALVLMLLGVAVCIDWLFGEAICEAYSDGKVLKGLFFQFTGILFNILIVAAIVTTFMRWA